MSAAPHATNPVEEALLTAIRLASELCKSGFYGRLTLHYQDGKVTHLTKEENIRPVSTKPRTA